MEKVPKLKTLEDTFLISVTFKKNLFRKLICGPYI